PDHLGRPTFLWNGTTGLPPAFVAHAFSPDPMSPSLLPTPTTFLGVHPPFHTAPFAPPPFELSFRQGEGWSGIGLLQVPDATLMELTPEGGIYLNYPLATLMSIRDQGAGGRVVWPKAVPGEPASGTWLGFPSLVFTFGASPALTLLAYHAALRQMGEAPTAPGLSRPPDWWSWPMVDTWGQQLVVGAARTSPKYTAAWVANFVRQWRRQFGVDHFTVILDAQWQARLGYPTPSARFGGLSGMRHLIQRLHSQGLKVLLWWPLWKQQSVTGRRSLVDPTTTAFPSLISSQMTELVGSGPRDLGANGLKLDWGFLVPSPSLERVSRPQMGLGADLLLRYMTLLSRAAWKANPRALIDGSAVAPQFGGTEDTLRLYDAASASTWSYRAFIVSAVDPGSLIDGDGWHLNQSQAVAHLVQSAVFGTPAMYYATRWSGGDIITRPVARALGSVLALAQQRGRGGQAKLLADGQWTYQIKGRLTASTLDGSHALAVYGYSSSDRLTRATVVSAVTTAVRIASVGRAVPRGVADPGGGRVRYRRQGAILEFAALAGDRYVVSFSTAARRVPHQRRGRAKVPPTQTGPQAPVISARARAFRPDGPRAWDTRQANRAQLSSRADGAAPASTLPQVETWPATVRALVVRAGR
ncbi:MAG: hypothetical protein ACYCYK_14125, partial [Candidatus Dormibacteria bacterium]